MKTEASSSTDTRSSRKTRSLSKREIAKAISVPMNPDRNALLANSRQDAMSIHSKIETAAYYRAEKRGFEPGHELEDWLAAEAEVTSHSTFPTLSIALSETMTTQSGRPS